jgi:membrane protease YdiL (CAAX protease family)
MRLVTANDEGNRRMAHCGPAGNCMKPSKWMAVIPPYLAIWAGLFLFRNAWSAVFGFHLSILLALALARPRIPVSVLFKTRHFAWTRRSAAVCAAIGIALFFFRSQLGVADDLGSRLKALGLAGPAWPAFIAYFSIANPLLEEYFWRAYLGSDAEGISTGDALYGGYHALALAGLVHPLTNILAVLALTAAGWTWRRIYRQDGGLLVPVLGHMAADFTILFSAYLITG